MSELKPCPFCGMNYAENAWDEFSSEYWVCEFCGAASGTERDEYSWNTRPIEDDLRKRIAELENEHNVWLIGASNAVKNLEARIAELEALVNVSEGLYERIYEQAARIAELEAESDQLTAHSDIERQDDKWIPEVQE